MSNNERTMNCPKCVDRPMTERQTTRVLIDQCEICRGVWFDKKELNKAIKAKIVESELEKLGTGKRFCPVCDSRMIVFRIDSTSTKIDRCSDCQGIWLDGGEYRKIRKHYTEKAESQDETASSGLKGSLLKFVNESIAKLSGYD